MGVVYRLPNMMCFFFASRRRHTRSLCDWSSDVCSSDLDAERRIGMHLNALRSIQQPASADAAADRDRLIESVGGTSLFSLGFLLLFTFAIGAVNSFLLAIFFKEVIGSYRVLPYPLPDLQASNLIALIIFVAEVATGWAVYRSGDLHRRADRARAAGAAFFDAIPWV